VLKRDVWHVAYFDNESVTTSCRLRDDFGVSVGMRLFPALLAALALAAPAVAQADSGVRGVVMRGPTMPVCQEGVPCTAPAANVTLVFARAGVTVVVQTNVAGRYRVGLHPGTWTVSLRPPRKLGRGIEPRSVVVRAGAWTTANLSIDTGIR
jgi:hypothetical protein